MKTDYLPWSTKCGQSLEVLLENKLGTVADALLLLSALRVFLDLTDNGPESDRNPLRWSRRAKAAIKGKARRPEKLESLRALLDQTVPSQTTTKGIPLKDRIENKVKSVEPQLHRWFRGGDCHHRVMTPDWQDWLAWLLAMDRKTFRKTISRSHQSVRLATKHSVLSRRSKRKAQHLPTEPPSTALNAEDLGQTEPIVIAPLPTGVQQLIGREDKLSQIDTDWHNANVHITTLVGFGGVGKTSIISKWLHKFSREPNPYTRRIVVYSFYKQGAAEGSASSDVFLHEALRRCDDPNPSLGSPSQKGERLAKILQAKKTLLILDGLETIQEKVEDDKARIRDPGVHSLLNHLALSNPGLALITSRLPLSDLSPSPTGPVVEHELEGLSPPDGAKLLVALGVHGPRPELEKASRQLKGHCLCLHLLGNFLSEVHGGNVLARSYLKLIGRHTTATEKARRIAQQYSRHLKPHELALMRLVSLFDRPTEPAAIEAIVTSSPILGFTTELPHPADEQWRLAVTRLRKAHLLNESQDGHPAALDCHPLLREYFAEDFETKLTPAWIRAHRILGKYFSEDVPRHPDTVGEMDRLLRGIAHSCAAQQEEKALSELYLERAMRNDEDFAVNNLGMLGSVVAALSHFFKDADWAKPTSRLHRAGQISLLKEAGRHLTALKGYAAAEVGACYGAGLRLLDRKTDANQRLDLLLGLCRHFRLRGALKKSAFICEQLRSLSEKLQTEAATKATERAFAANYFYTGQFALCDQHATSGDIPLRNKAQGFSEAHRDLNDPSLSCRGYRALALWLLGDTVEATKVAGQVKQDATHLGHPHTKAIILLITAMVAHFSGRPQEVQNEATELYDLTSEKGYFIWRIAAQILKAWAAANEDPNPSSYLAEIRKARREWTQNEARLFLPYWYGIGADVALMSTRADQALEETERGLDAALENGEHWWDAELLRLKAIAMARTDASPRKIRDQLDLALRTALVQGAKSLQRRISRTAEVLLVNPRATAAKTAIPASAPNEIVAERTVAEASASPTIPGALT